MKKVIKKKVDKLEVKIIKETPIKCTKLDVEMSPSLYSFLLRHAEQEMTRKEQEDLLVEGAFVNLLKRCVEKENAKLN